MIKNAWWPFFISLIPTLPFKLPFYIFIYIYLYRKEKEELRALLFLTFIFSHNLAKLHNVTLVYSLNYTKLWSLYICCDDSITKSMSLSFFSKKNSKLLFFLLFFFVTILLNVGLYYCLWQCNNMSLRFY
jgi:hypothetical protein